MTLEALAEKAGLPYGEARRAILILLSPHRVKKARADNPRIYGHKKPRKKVRPRINWHEGDFNHEDFPHGTSGGYGRYGCRCFECTEANRLKGILYRQRARERRCSLAA